MQKWAELRQALKAEPVGFAGGTGVELGSRREDRTLAPKIWPKQLKGCRGRHCSGRVCKTSRADVGTVRWSLKYDLFRGEVTRAIIFGPVRT